MSLPDVQPRPCNECPWRRNSTPGWLGPHSADEWSQLAHSEAPVACHTTIDSRSTDEEGNASWDQPGLRQCAGIAIYRTHICKKPRDPEVATLPADRDNIFGYGEFQKHHAGRKS